MAGNYPDVPGYQMYYDSDGSVGFLVSSTNTITQLTSTNLTNLNDVSDSTSYGVASGSTVRVGVIFPQLRDLTGYFIRTSLNTGAGSDGSGTIETSTNTTNGLDGTWTSLGAFTNTTSVTIPAYRSNISSVTSNGVIGVRFNKGGIYGSTYYTMHLYGNIASGQTPDRLALWDPTLDQAVGAAFFDWGDVPRGSSATKNFRLKNLSSTLTASNITVSLSALTDTSPTVVSQLALSNGGAYGATTTVSSLAPGAISGTLSIQRTISASATLGLWTQQLKASAASWA